MADIELNDKLEQGCKELGIELTKDQVKKFEDYYKTLVEWNKVMNLTSIVEYEDVIQKHFIDSLTIVKGIDISKCKRVIDIGTGAGFPGIPLKIIYPHLEVVLLDSLNKKVNFLNEVINILELKNISAIHGRAEDYAKQKGYRESFDLCVSRAVANLALLTEYCLPYTMLEGCFVSYKSGVIDEEVQSAKKAIFLLGGELQDVVKFSLPDSDIDRSLVMIKKVKHTPAKYPRKAGLPAKEPLI